MSDYVTTRLITDTQEDFYTACQEAGLVDEESGEVCACGVGYCLDVIDPYMVQSGTITDEDGNEIPEYIEEAGFHVNQSACMLTGLEHLSHVVLDPIRRFAGETYASQTGD